MMTIHPNRLGKSLLLCKLRWMPTYRQLMRRKLNKMPLLKTPVIPQQTNCRVLWMHRLVLRESDLPSQQNQIKTKSQKWHRSLVSQWPQNLCNLAITRLFQMLLLRLLLVWVRLKKKSLVLLDQSELDIFWNKLDLFESIRNTFSTHIVPGPSPWECKEN